MNRITHRSNYSIEKVLEEVQEARCREHEIHSSDSLDQRETNQLEFCPGIVHLLKDKFSKLSKQRQSQFGPSLGNGLQPRSKSVTNLVTPELETDHSSNYSSRDRSPFNFRTSSENITNIKFNDSEIHKGDSKSVFSDSSARFDRRSSLNSDEKVSESAQEREAEAEDFEVLPIKNIVSATRSIFESLNVYSDEPQTNITKRETPEGYSPSEGVRVRGGHSKTLTFFAKQAPKQPDNSVLTSKSLSSNRSLGVINSNDSTPITHTHVAKSFEFKSNSVSTIPSVVVKPSLNRPPSVPLVETSPANEYAPMARVAATRKSFQAAELEISKTKSQPSIIPKKFSNSNRITPKPVQKVTPNGKPDPKSSWKSWEDIPLPPKRKTFVDEAKHVKISEEDVKSSRRAGKSWIFSTDVNSVSTENSVAIQVKPSSNVSNALTHTPQLTKERQAQQTFWDSYRTEDVRGHTPTSDLVEEARQLMATCEKSDDSGEDSDVDTSGNKELIVAIASVKSSLKGGKERKKSVRLWFADETKLTSVFEYQSERSFLQELGLDDYEDQMSILTGINAPEIEISSDEENYTEVAPTSTPLPPPVKMSAYKSKLVSDFAWGANPIPLLPTTVISSTDSIRQSPTIDNTDDKDDVTVSSWSTTANGEADLLF